MNLYLELIDYLIVTGSTSKNNITQIFQDVFLPCKAWAVFW